MRAVAGMERVFLGIEQEGYPMDGAALLVLDPSQAGPDFGFDAVRAAFARGLPKVVTEPGHDAPTVEDLREYLLARGIAIHKTPERVVAVDALPMNATGKFLKHELRKDIARRLGEEAAQARDVTGTR